MSALVDPRRGTQIIIDDVVFTIRGLTASEKLDYLFRHGSGSSGDNSWEVGIDVMKSCLLRGLLGWAMKDGSDPPPFKYADPEMLEWLSEEAFNRLAKEIMKLSNFAMAGN